MAGASMEMAARFGAGPGSTPGADPAALGGSATLEGGSSAAAIAACAASGSSCSGRGGAGGAGTGPTLGGSGRGCEPLDAEADFGAVGASKSERLRFRLSSWPCCVGPKL